ncbi:MAG: hypothetical protein LBF34_03555 [Puniceicoccales bacterium]|jgi:hypothetical protein|nr:hypothetical protein [Puniceicoccales bacterium]
MTIKEAFVQFRSEFYWGNICNAIGNFFQNVSSSPGDKETSKTMGSAPTCKEPSASRDAQLAKIFGTESDANAFESPERVSWDEAYNQELGNLKEQAKPSIRAFFDGPTPTSTYDLDNMTLDEAKQLLGIRDGEETRLDVSERCTALKGEALEIHNEYMRSKVGVPEPPPGHREKLRYMEQKFEKAAELVGNSDFAPISQPKWTHD